MSKWITGLLIGLAFVTQMVVMLPSGSTYCHEDRCGDYYWGVHEHDGIWHLALANAAFKGLPLSMPTFAGARLTGYNWLIDLPIFLLTKVGVPAQFTYFKILPVIWFLLMIVSWRTFARSYSHANEKYWQWLLFFLFFGSSLSFILTLWHQGSLVGNSALLAMQPPMMLSNIQFAYTLPLLASVAGILFRNKKRFSEEVVLLVTLFVAFGLKFYGGAIILAFIVIHSLLYKQWKRMVAVLCVATAAIVLFYQPKWGGSAILSFAPLATVYPIIEEKLLFYVPPLANARYSPNLLKQVVVAIVAVTIFIMFNFGTRLIGILRVGKLTRYEWSVFLTAMVAVLANILLVQRGEWWNTVQFLYYGFFLLNILVAKELAEWEKGNKTPIAKRIVMILVVAFSVPGSLDTLRVFAHFPAGSYVSEQEKEILGELKNQPEGVVLALPLTRSEAGLSYSPAPLYHRYETAYVAAYTGKLTYFNDTVQSRLVGINYSDREIGVKSGDCQVLDEIDYIYIAGEKSQIQPWEQCNRQIKIIKSNDVASLYQVM